MRILVFGDSIAWGAWDSEGGWVARLDKDIKQRIIAHLPDVTDYPEVYNFSSSGETIHGILGRFEFETEGHRWRDEPFCLIFAVGGNDAVIEKGRPWCEPASMQHDLKLLLTKAKKLSSYIFFVGPSPVDEARTTPVCWGDYHYTNARTDEFATVYREMCEHMSVSYISLREVFWDNRKQLLSDGLHPNDKGHEIIFGQVRRALNEGQLLEIT